MPESPTKNKSVKYKVVQYLTGEWAGKWVVVEIIEQDLAAVHTEHDALELIRKLGRK